MTADWKKLKINKKSTVDPTQNNITWMGDCLNNLTCKKTWPSGGVACFPLYKLQTTSHIKPLGQIQPNLIEMFLGWSMESMKKSVCHDNRLKKEIQ